jgi:hypothetical protein
MKTSTSLLALLCLLAFIGCTGPTTPQEAAADQRAMAYDNQQEQDTMDEDIGYEDPAMAPAVGENPIMDPVTAE